MIKCSIFLNLIKINTQGNFNRKLSLRLQKSINQLTDYDATQIAATDINTMRYVDSN